MVSSVSYEDDIGGKSKREWSCAGCIPMSSLSDTSRSNNETQMSGMELESPSSSYSLNPPYHVHLTW